MYKVSTLTPDSPDTAEQGALKNISLTIEPGQKIGLVGRTGRQVALPRQVECPLTRLQWQNFAHAEPTRVPQLHRQHPD